MTVEEVLGRVDELCAERGWSHYTLAKESKMATSSVYNMFKRKTIPKVETLEKVCDGFQITLGEFFSPEDILVINEEMERLGFHKEQDDGQVTASREKSAEGICRWT